MENLARLYWKPILAYVRAKGWDPSDALDATQDFFVWMIEKKFLVRLDPDRGSFRGFIKKSLVRFLEDLSRKRRTLKRGGSRNFIPLTEGEAENLDIPDPAGLSPDLVLDQLWRKELLAQGMDRLEEELQKKKKETLFHVFYDYYLGEEDLDYNALAVRYTITTTDVSNYLIYVKKRYRAHLQSAVLETVQSNDELRAELAWLFEEPNQ